MYALSKRISRKFIKVTTAPTSQNNLWKECWSSEFV